MHLIVNIVGLIFLSYYCFLWDMKFSVFFAVLLVVCGLFWGCFSEDFPPILSVGGVTGMLALFWVLVAQVILIPTQVE